MPSAANTTPLATRLLLGAANLASLSWPIAARLFPERLEIDTNRSLWITQAGPYHPLPALDRSIDADVAIIGGGFTGTSTAYHLSQQFPNRRIVLLEAATLGNGASGRNGGMVLNWVNGFGDDDLELTRRIYALTSQGIREIATRIEQHGLDVDLRLDGTLTVLTDAQRAEAAHASVEVHQSLGIPERFIDAETLARELHLEGTYGAVLDPGTGQMNGAQLTRGLRPVLQQQGVMIYEGTPVLKVSEGTTITLTTPQGEVRAKAMVLATNGYTGKLGYFRDAVLPLHSHVMASEALTAEQQKTLGWNTYAGYSDDLDRISYSVMTRAGHLVFGGGSNDSYDYLFRNRTAYPGSPERAMHGFAAMQETLQTYMPGTNGLLMPHRWTGTLAITLDRKPLIGVRGEAHNIYYGLGYSGHGVTLANVVGRILADLYAGNDDEWRTFPFINSRYARIPPEPFRWMGYQFFTRLTGKSPRI